MRPCITTARRCLSPGLMLAVLLTGCGDERSPTHAGAPGPGDPGRTATSVPRHFPDASLLIVSLDTLRADDVGSYGGPEGISPTLDRLAAEGIVFEQARSAAPTTAPSHMSLFTSQLPSVHGVHNVFPAVAGAEGTLVEEDGDSFFVSPLPETIPTLAEVLTFRGFATAAFTDGGNVSPVHGFARGFDVYTTQAAGVADDVAEALAWWREHGFMGAGPDPAAGRFFVFWHTYLIHSPYAPPPEYIERFASPTYQGPLRARVAEFSAGTPSEPVNLTDSAFWEGKDDFTAEDIAFLRDAYRGGVRQTDDVLARLFDDLRRDGLLERMIVVVLSDHGEEFNEHGGFVHSNVFEECLSVPLIVRLPGGVGGGRRITTRVSLLDVMPTVLDLLGFGAEAIELLEPSGRSLADAITGGGEPPRRPLSAESMQLRRNPGLWRWRGVHWVDDYKFLWEDDRLVGSDTWQPKERQLFHLGADPAEQHDLAPTGDRHLPLMESLHEEWRRGVSERAGKMPAAAAELTREQLEQLRRLGYIDG